MDGGPLTLTTDPRRIERILANLVGQRGRAHAAAMSRCRTGTDGAHGWIDVADAGSGHRAGAPAARLRAFYKADSARVDQGSGLLAWLSRSRTPGSWAEISACPVTWHGGSVFRLTPPLGPRRMM